MSNPNRRRRPVWCGDVDTTRPGGAWDVQDDGCCNPCKPPVPGCRPPMPQFPDCGYHIPPVQYVPGMNEQEQLANLNCKMNELIELFNCNTDKVYGAYEEVVRSAVCNDAFYKEITVESGYLADASTSYELVHIPFVDCAGQPIYMEMGLAYNNTTNSGVTESVFDKALEVYADKILPAAERSFQGVTIWKGAPIYSGETQVGARALIPGECDYTLGVTENGYFKIYDTPKETDNSGMIKTMRQDKVRNSMGCAVIIRGGEYVVDENLADMELPCTVLAMNYKTKERFILVIGKDNVASAITPEMIANLLKKYDVDVAALTSWGQQSYLLDKGLFSFMPTSTDSDGIPTVPQSAAFWYITKRRHFHNDYVKEVAALTIQMGENLWYDELTSEAVDNLKLDFVDLRNDLEQEIQDRKDADAALGERIDKEIAERKAADTALDEKYAGEVARLDGEIEALEQRVTAEVTRLDALIQSTKEALTAKDVKEVKVTHNGTRDTYQVVLNDGTVLGADVIVYNYDQLVQKLDSYATVEQRLDAEIQARKDADDALNALITAEQQARANGDTALAEQIASVKAELTELIQGNTTDITALQGALDTLTQTVQSNYTSLNERVTNNAENIANLQGSYGALQATVAALNETVTGLQQSFASTEQSFENVKQTVANMQDELNAFEERIEGELGNYLPLSGGTLTGPLDVEQSDAVPTKDGLHHYAANDYTFYSYYADDERPARKFARFGVGEPVDDSHAATKKYVDTVGENLAGEIGEQFGNYLPLSGGKMTGTVNLNGNWITNVSQLTFNYQNFNNPQAMFIRRAPGRPTFNYSMYVFKGDGSSDNKEAGIEVNLVELGNSVSIAGVQGGDAPWTGDEYKLVLFHSDGVEAGPVYVTNVATPITDDGAANKAYVDAAVAGGASGNYLPLTGGTVTGPTTFRQKVTADTIDMSGGPNGNILGAMTVEFELTQQAPSGYAIMRNDTLNGFGAYNESAPTPFAVGAPTQDYHAATKAYVDTVGENLAGEIAEVGGQLGNYLPLSGGQMRGALDMNFKNVENMRRMGFGEAGNSRYYTLFDDETLKLIDENISSQGIGHFNLDCGAITTWRGYLNTGVRIWTSAMTTPSKPVLDIEGITDGAKVRITNIATPIIDDDVATKGYVDAADEGFLYVDGGRLYAHGDSPQNVFLDKIEFSSQGAEDAGVVTVGVSGTKGSQKISFLDEDLRYVPLSIGTGELTDDTAAVNMNVLGKYMRDYFSGKITSANVNVSDILTGLYLVRYVSEVYMLNVIGAQVEAMGSKISKLMGDQSGSTFEVSFTDDNNMIFTFSEPVDGIMITKLTGGGYVTIKKLS